MVFYSYICTRNNKILIIMRNFTVEDFSGSGQYLLRMSPQEIHCKETGKTFSGYCDTEYLSTILYKVGYMSNNFNIGNGEQITCLISMADGWTRISHFSRKHEDGSTDFDSKVIWQKDKDDKYGGKRKLVEYLNNPELSQEMRFATQEEITRVVMCQDWRWRNK